MIVKLIFFAEYRYLSFKKPEKKSFDIIGTGTGVWNRCQYYGYPV
jgi:hypothetical protein